MPSLPIPAATLILFRETLDGGRSELLPELLMVERAKHMAFAASAIVFPGGRIDPGDHKLAATFAGDPDDLAGRIAAIRETIEEVGVAIGLTPVADQSVVERLRAVLQSGDTLAAALDTAGCTIDLNALTPFARWLPSHHSTRVFDARFYLARMPSGAPPPVVDATENVRVFWSTAQSVLDDADAGRVQILYPTRRNLERLARFASFTDAVVDAAAYPVRIITPSIEDRDGVPHLCIPGDLGYPVTAEPMSQTTRG